MVFILLAIIFIKPLLYFVFLTQFKLRARTAFFSALTMNNYSEFGLIIVVLSVEAAWLNTDWVVIIALILSLSFIIGAAFDGRSHELYRRHKKRLCRYQSEHLISEQQPVDLGNAAILVLGMGRVGSAAYDYMQRIYGDVTVGIEENVEKAAKERAKGRRIIDGDASDNSLWEQLNAPQLKLILLALSNHQEALTVSKLIKESGFQGQVATTARYPDEVKELQEMGLIAYNLYEQAGIGFADHVHQQIEDQGVHNSHHR